MASVNIPSYHEDPNYRYKMPRIRAKIEGRGNGIRTNIMNMGDIARALKRPPEYATRFCGCELGASSKFESAEGKAIVNGAHTDGDLQQIIDKFVDKFVLCPNCRLPEIDLIVSRGRVRGKCNACGFSGDMDNSHKVGTYILKNPPDGGDSTMGGGKGTKGSAGKKSKEERQRERAEKAALKKSESDADNEEDEGYASSGGAGRETTAELTKSSSSKKSSKSKDESGKHHKEHKHKSSKSGGKEKKEKEKKEKKTTSRQPSDELDANDNLSTAEEKATDQQQQQSAGRDILEFDSEEILAVINRLRTFVNSDNKERPTPQAFFQEVRLLQVAQDFDAKLRVYVALAALFNDEEVKAATIKENAAYLNSVCDRSVSGPQILQAFEHYIYRLSPKTLNHYAHICSQLYNLDLVDEETFLDRYGRPDVNGQRDIAKGQACTAASTFVNWLQNAESASPSSEGEDSD